MKLRRLALFVSLTSACADPAPVAVEACQALPGLATDAAGLELLRPLLVTAEVELLEGAEPTRGLDLVGAEGLAKLRADTVCVAGDVNSAGAGRWAVPLTRTSPTLNADGSLGEAQEQSFDWQVVKGDGLRVETGLAKAQSMLRSAAKALDEDDPKRFSSGLRALARSYPDPLLAVDVAEAEALELRLETLGKLRVAFVSVEGDDVIGQLSNRNKVEIAQVTVRATFSVAGAPVDAEVTVGPVAADGILEVKVPVPEGAEGNVQLKAVDFGG